MSENDQPLNSPYIAQESQERSRAEDFYTFYANNLSVTFTSWEMSVVFGEITGTKDGKPVIEEIAKVIMTREFAKVVSVLLSSNIAAYEAKFGEIKSPHFELKPKGDIETVDFDPLNSGS